MFSYRPSPELIGAVLKAISMPLPFVASMALWFVPSALKNFVIGNALSLIVPMSLGAIALTRSGGARVALTTHGELTEEAKKSFVKRVAGWLVPDEVTALTDALHKDIVRLARDGYGTEAWRLEVRENEIVLVVLDTSLIRVTADTVIDIFFDSIGALAHVKDAVFQKLGVTKFPLNVALKLESYLGDVFAGVGMKEVQVETFEEAVQEAREWVRRNRAHNAERPEMRYKVVVTYGDETWVHDETKDNPLLEPTESTVVACAP